MARDLEKAVEQIVATLKRHLLDYPPEKFDWNFASSETWKMALLSEANLLNAARHVAMGLDEYGRKETTR